MNQNFFALIIPSLQTDHVHSTLKRRGNGRFHVVSTWNTRGVFVRIELFSVALDHVCILNWSGESERENNHEKQFMSQQNQQSSLTHNIQKSYATSHCILN